MSLEIKNLTVLIDGSTTLDQVSLDVPEGSLFALLGPSGCGKSTLLKTVAGLIPQKTGEIRWDGFPIDHLPPERRGMVMVFQDLRLFPHMTVLDNVAFPLKMAGIDKTTRHQAAEKMLAMVKMQGLENRRPHQLSGGQQQRVVLARALVANPKVLLLDEPFSSLDEPLRVEMRALVKELHHELGITMILVTHDRMEALSMSSRMAVMEPGKILQTGSPQELYHHPSNLAVAKQLLNGSIITGNLLQGVFTGLGFHLSGGPTEINGAVSVLIPDKNIQIGDGRGDFTVLSRNFAGSHDELILSNGYIELRTFVPSSFPLKVGESVELNITIESRYVFQD